MVACAASFARFLWCIRVLLLLREGELDPFQVYGVWRGVTAVNLRSGEGCGEAHLNMRSPWTLCYCVIHGDIDIWVVV